MHVVAVVGEVDAVAAFDPAAIDEQCLATFGEGRQTDLVLIEVQLGNPISESVEEREAIGVGVVAPVEPIAYPPLLDFPLSLVVSEPRMKGRGACRNRTGVNGFAGRCVTTPPRRRAPLSKRVHGTGGKSCAGSAVAILPTLPTRGHFCQASAASNASRWLSIHSPALHLRLLHPAALPPGRVGAVDDLLLDSGGRGSP